MRKHLCRVPSPTPQSSKNSNAREAILKKCSAGSEAIWTSPFICVARWRAGCAAGSGNGRPDGHRWRTGDRLPNRAACETQPIVSYAGSTYGVGRIAATFYLVRPRPHDEERARRPFSALSTD